MNLNHFLTFIIDQHLNRLIMYRGRQKKLQNLVERKSSNSNNLKTPFLHEHSSKIQQKLAYLKQKISEKKKNGGEKKNHTVTNDLAIFMNKIGLTQYLKRLEENGIDSYEILREVKQSQLEEIGIAKGHALKIVVNLKKEEERQRKKNLAQNKSRVESTLDESAIKKVSKDIVKKQEKKQLPEIYQTQTESIPFQPQKKQFCLYCFSRSELNFCSTNCQTLYNSMFQRYERNLQKAEESFVPKEVEQNEKENEQLSDNQEFMESFDFLFSPQLQNFAIQEYEKIKEIIKK